MSAEVREQVQRLVETLRGFNPALLSGADCAALAEDLAVAGKACLAAQARAAARAAECGAHRSMGYTQPADWLARVSGSSVGEAKAALETAAAVEAVPEVQDALTQGSLSLAQAWEIARTEEIRPGSAELLLDVARRRGLAAVRDEGRRMRLAVVDAEELHRKQRAARSFRHWRDDFGMVCFRGALAPADGIAFVNRLDAEADRIRREARREARREGSTEPFEAHAADALVQLTADNGKGRSRSADVVVVVDLNAWRRGKAEEGEPCHIVGGGPVPVALAKELAADAFLKAVVHDGVEIKAVRHFGRHIPAELRTALELGAPPSFEGIECAGGCGRRCGLEWDHRNPVANGGPTSYDNIDPRCFCCHREKTERDRKAGLLRGRGP